MKEEYVTYEQAVKLKELGFDWECNQYYLSDYEDIINHTKGAYNHNDNGLAYSAPRLDQAQKWLREKCNISIEIVSISAHKWQIFLCRLYDTTSSVEHQMEYQETYELALSAGIDAALELSTDKLNDK